METVRLLDDKIICAQEVVPLDIPLFVSNWYVTEMSLHTSSMLALKKFLGKNNNSPPPIQNKTKKTGRRKSFTYCNKNNRDEPFCTSQLTKGGQTIHQVALTAVNRDPLILSWQ